MNHEPACMGYVGGSFLAQYAHLPNVVTLAEILPRHARQVADHYGIPIVYGSPPARAGDPPVEAVSISAGFTQQGEIAAELPHARKHVFMEKVMAISIAQAARITGAARG